MKKDYLSQLSRWARWMLPRQEAEDVIADYCDIVGVPLRSEDELIRDLGRPRNVVKAVTQPRQYRAWLFAFGTLAVCVAFPAVMAYKSVYWGPVLNPAYMIFLCIGVGLSLGSFRRDRVGKETLIRGLLLPLALLLMGIGGVWFLAGLMLTESWELLNVIVPTADAAQGMHVLLCLGILAMALIALYGLVRARLEGRRWCAVYILGLSGVLLGLSFWLFLRSTVLTAGPGWQTPILLRYAFITILGLIGTGAALC